jgi:hypothetical protein
MLADLRWRRDKDISSRRRNGRRRAYVSLDPVEGFDENWVNSDATATMVIDVTER